ncbi:MAG: hypothetical protein JXR95_00385 [Deltaproteobacteria bacterium]|nr:hypothetical protein [Deltaproteobacteria bacterium]
MELSRKLHGAAVNQKTLRRLFKLVLAAILGGGLIAAVTGVAVGGIIVRNDSTSILDTSLIFPLSVLFITGTIIMIMRYLIRNPVVRFKDMKLFFGGVSGRSYSFDIKDAGEATVKSIPGGVILLIPFGEKICSVEMNRRNSGEFLREIKPWLNSSYGILEELSSSWIPHTDFAKSTKKEKLEFYINWGFADLVNTDLLENQEISEGYILKYYQHLKVSTDYICLGKIHPLFCRLIPSGIYGFDNIILKLLSLDKAGVVESSSIKDQEVESYMEEILIKWRKALKYRKIPDTPYTTISSRIISGSGNWFLVTSDGKLRYRDGEYDPSFICAYRGNFGIIGLNEIELRDISGRKFVINRDVEEILSFLRLKVPWAMEFSNVDFPSILWKRRYSSVISLFAGISPGNGSCEGG